MDFLRKKRAARQADNSSTGTSHVKSTETTPYQSGVPSDFEKEIPTEPSVHSARSKSDSHTPEGGEATARPEDGATAIESAEKKLEAIEKEQEEENEDDIEYPKAMKLTLITIALCLSVFCMALDNTIISTAIPKITDEFKAINDVGRTL